MNIETVASVALESFATGIYKKNIHYIFHADAPAEEFQIIKSTAGSAGVSAWMIQQSHRRHGVQMQVSMEVSRDLMATDFASASKVENVPFPAKIVEVFFEDPLLPTILIMKANPEEIQQWFPQLTVGLKHGEYITALMQEGSDVASGKFLSVQLRSDMYERFLTTGETESMEKAIFSSELSQMDNCAISYMMNLALKVFAFASVPTYKPQSISRKQMSFGGKPDVKGRPQRPSLKVSYLPKNITTGVPLHSLKDTVITFKGRRGHIRWYNSEKFVNRKGTWDFIQPLKDPKTGQYPLPRVLKVRKPV